MVNLTETAWQPGAEKALRLDGRITRLGEGSQAARAFAGLYGARKARKGHLKESFDDTARDLTRFLVRPSRGEAPGKA